MSVILIPSAIARFEQEIKKSRFIAYATPVSSPAAVQSYIAQKRSEYPDAGHICSAFVIGPEGGERQTGQSDDGEPSETAGMPMLNVLQHSDMIDLAVIVIRYFGGIKLGKGGLARAYSSSVSEVLKITPSVEKIPVTQVVFTADFAQEDQIRRCLQQAAAENLHVEYAQQLTIKCDIPIDQIESLRVALGDLSRGAITLKDD